MLNRNFAIALAVAMVLAVLYGCSSSGGIKNERDMFKEDAEMLQGSLDTANEKVMGLTGELDMAKARVTELDGMLATANSTNMDLQGELDMAKARVTELDGMLATANSTNMDLQGMLDMAKARVTELDGMLATANSTNMDLQGELDMAKARVTELDGMLATANSTNMDLQGMLDMAKARVTELDGMLATANSTNMDLQGMLDMAKARVTELDDTIASLRTELGTATGNAGVLTARNAGFATAQTARENAIAAGTAATDAVSKATTKSGELDTLDVAGDSAMARQNAQDVLDAKTEANAAVEKAKDALDSAKASAGDLGLDIEAEMSTDALTRALKEAIGVAETQYMAAMQSRDSDALKNAVEIITGAEPEAEDYPMEPLDHGKAVAMDIGGALMATSTTDGAGTRVMHGAVAATESTDPSETHVKGDNHVGSTWADIVGAGNIMKMRIAISTDDTDLVNAASITDEPRSSITLEGPLNAVQLEDGAEHEGDYKDIPGTVFCAGTCGVMMGTDGETLTGDWFFNPTSEIEWYVRNAADTGYMPETLYARFGHWLSTVTDGTQINTYAMTGGDTGSINVITVDTAEGATELTDNSATYTGDAVGMSLHKEFDGQGGIVPGSRQSAPFTARVELKAAFGPSPTLAGTVLGFQGGATDPDWEVELLSTGFTGAEVTAGTTVSSGQDGEWTATAFGPVTAPDGHLRRLQRPLHGRACGRGVRHPEVSSKRGVRNPV